MEETKTCGMCGRILKSKKSVYIGFGRTCHKKFLEQERQRALNAGLDGVIKNGVLQLAIPVKEGENDGE